VLGHAAESGRGRLRARLGRAGNGFTRTTPYSRKFGLDRGRAVDRHYIERFLEAHGHDIRGRVLEIGDSTYTERFGTAVERADVLHVTGAGGATTIVGDLATGEGVPEGAFDAILLTQTLPFIFRVHDAAHNVLRALAPGGVALVTLPGISQISRYDMDRWGDYWRFTQASAEQLFTGAGWDAPTVSVHGNVAAAAAFLYGLSADELRPEVLDEVDPDYPVIVTVRAVRSQG
jgi:hypothetical protein